MPRNRSSTEKERRTYPPIIRPIFDWSEVENHFPQAAPEMDYSLLSQLLQKKAQDMSPSIEEQSRVQGFSTKVMTVIENLILTGEGEQLMLEEVRLVGSQKKGTAIAGSLVTDIVVLYKDIPQEKIVNELGLKVKGILETTTDENKVKVEIISRGKCFDMCTDGAIVRVFSTSTGHVIFGSSPESLGDDFEMYAHALRMIRHTRWWQENTDQLKNIRSLVRIIKSMKGHVPGLNHLNTWYIELICQCALIPLNDGEPLSLVDGFRRLFQLLAAGLFLPGSIGLPDPCEEGDETIHETMLPEQCEELTSNGQMILVLLQFGAYREILGCDGAIPAKLSEPYTFGGLTLNVAPPAYLTSLDM